MPPRFGIDTSILVRVVTGDPEAEYQRCLKRLTQLVEQEDAELFACNQVVGEAYVALQHHYGVSKTEARGALASVLRSGLVAPLNGQAVFAALAADTGCGLLDRLLADGYQRNGLITLTLDRRMAALPDAQAL